MKTEAERQLAALVAMATISDDAAANEQALGYIEQYLAKRGMYTNRFQFDGHGSLVASSRPDNFKNPAVLLAGHVDVVAGGEQLFTLQERGDKLIGRGVYDMKFSIAGYMQLVDDLQGRLEDYDFAIMITTDEEYGGRSGFNGTETLVKLGYRPGVCILPDSAAPGWDIEYTAKAPWRFELVAKGRTAHGSRPWEGESASFKLIHALHDLKELFKNQGPQTATLNIGIIHGGEAFNQIPSLVTAAAEIRIVEQEDYHRLLPIIQDICQRHRVEYVERVVRSVVKNDLSNPFLVAYMDSVQKVTGRRPKSSVSYASSDGRHFANVGVPYILSCPEGGGHHSEEEWISRRSFRQFVPILQDYLEQKALSAAKPDRAPALAEHV